MQLDFKCKQGIYLLVVMAVPKAVKKKGGFKLVHPDHYSCLLTLKDLPKKGMSEKEEKRSMWNLAKVGGWEAYEKITNEKAETLNKMMEEKETPIEEKMQRFKRLHDKIKFRAFGKVQIKETSRTSKESKNEKSESAEEMFNNQKNSLLLKFLGKELDLLIELFFPPDFLRV